MDMREGVCKSEMRRAAESSALQCIAAHCSAARSVQTQRACGGEGA